MAQTFGGQSVVLISVKLLLLACLGLIAVNVQAAESSLELNGSPEQYFAITDEEQVGLDITGDMSLSAWVKPAVGSLETQTTIASKWSEISETSFLFFLEQDKVGVAINYEGGDYDYKVLYAPHGKSEGEWFHVGMVYRAASGTAELFVNGVSVGKSAEGFMPSSMADSNADFSVGGRQTRIAHFTGNIDEVKVWSRALTNGQMLDQGTIPLTVKNGKNLQGFWKFNGNLRDRSVNTNHFPGPVYSSDTAF